MYIIFYMQPCTNIFPYKKTSINKIAILMPFGQNI